MIQQKQKKNVFLITSIFLKNGPTQKTVAFRMCGEEQVLVKQYQVTLRKLPQQVTMVITHFMNTKKILKYQKVVSTALVSFCAQHKYVVFLIFVKIPQQSHNALRHYHKKNNCKPVILF